MTTSNVERTKEKYTFYWSHQQILKDDQPMKREDAVTELNRLTERVAELEKERKILIAGLGVYFNVGPCDCEPGVGMICEACTKANEAIEAVNSLKIEGL